MNLLTHFLLQADQIQVALGAPGAILLFTLFVLSSVGNAYQAWRSKNADYLAGAAKALETEMNVYKNRAERLVEENKTQAGELGRLRSATDLSYLTKENHEQHLAIVVTLQQVLASVAENTKVILGFQSQVAGVFEAIQGQARATQEQASVNADVLRAIEHRLNDMDVKGREGRAGKGVAES